MPESPFLTKKNISHHSVRSHRQNLRPQKASSQINISQTHVTPNRLKRYCFATTTIPIVHHNTDEIHVQVFHHQQRSKNTLNGLSRGEPLFQVCKRHHPFIVLFLVRNASDSDGERQPAFFAWRSKQN